MPDRKGVSSEIMKFGVYMFGGLDKSYQLTNSLKIFLPGPKNLVWKDVDTSGQPPSARMLHSMTFMEKMNSIVIYGGRDMNKHCFLNDAHLLNLATLT